jgi:formamidopyrimidine-DNA glycosylase
MPELPEVEVIRRGLVPRLCGRTVSRVHVGDHPGSFLIRPALLARRLVGRRVLGLARHGKYLLAELDDGQRLLVHLGMTGRLGLASRRTPDRHTHLRLEFTDRGPELWFTDPRRFGRVGLLAPGRSHPRLERLGTDALVATEADLWRATRRRRVAVKTVLLDQSVLAGVGNIYADEALFRVGIRPTRAASRLTRRECRELVAAVKRVFARSIALGGTTVRDYRDSDGDSGAYQQALRVYGRQGEPCWECREPVRRVVLAQRSSHFCPCCQR